MNGAMASGLVLGAAIAARYRAQMPDGAVEILLCPPGTLLHAIAGAVAAGGLSLGGQDCHDTPCGAHTGDISATMLRDCGADYVILGHCERRQNHGETDDLIRRKLSAARTAGLVPILCVGETAAERADGATLSVIRGQITGSLPPDLPGAGLVIAYEPVWAIGTGKIPSCADVERVHRAIRHHLVGLVDDPSAVRLLYGGSVNAANATDLLALPDVDGALVGGASLALDSFWPIVEAARRGRAHPDGQGAMASE